MGRIQSSRPTALQPSGRSKPPASIFILSDIPYGIGADEWDVLHNNTNLHFLGDESGTSEGGRRFSAQGQAAQWVVRSRSADTRRIPAPCASFAAEWLASSQAGRFCFRLCWPPPCSSLRGRIRGRGIHLQGLVGVAPRGCSTPGTSRERSVPKVRRLCKCGAVGGMAGR